MNSWIDKNYRLVMLLAMLLELVLLIKIAFHP